MTTLVKRSSLVLGAVGLVAATAVTTAMVIESSNSPSRSADASFASEPSAPSAARSYAASSARSAGTRGANTRAMEPTRARAASLSTTDRTTSSRNYREVTLPAGTQIQLRLGSGYSSETSSVEDRVNATVVSGALAGSRVSGVVSAVDRPGRVKGRGSIGLSFSDVTVGGERYPMAASYTRVAPATKSTDAKKIGIPAAGGAIVGAILGGKKGALTGAAIGGGAGTAVVLSTRGKDAYIGSGSVIGVTLRRALTVRVPAR